MVSWHDYYRGSERASMLFFCLAGVYPVIPWCLRSRAFPPHLKQSSRGHQDFASFLHPLKAMSFILNENNLGVYCLHMKVEETWSRVWLLSNVLVISSYGLINYWCSSDAEEILINVGSLGQPFITPLRLWLYRALLAFLELPPLKEFSECCLKGENFMN